MAADEGTQVFGLSVSLEEELNLMDEVLVGFYEAFGGSLGFDSGGHVGGAGTASGAAGAVVQGVMPFYGDGSFEAVQVENVWTGSFGVGGRAEDAFEEEGVGDSDDEGTGGAAVEANRAEFGLHGHIGFGFAGIGDRADEVDERGHCFGAELRGFGEHDDGFAEEELLVENVKVRYAGHTGHDIVPSSERLVGEDGRWFGADEGGRAGYALKGERLVRRAVFFWSVLNLCSMSCKV